MSSALWSFLFRQSEVLDEAHPGSPPRRPRVPESSSPSFRPSTLCRRFRRRSDANQPRLARQAPPAAERHHADGRQRLPVAGRIHAGEVTCACVVGSPMHRIVDDRFLSQHRDPGDNSRHRSPGDPHRARCETNRSLQIASARVCRRRFLLRGRLPWRAQTAATEATVSASPPFSGITRASHIAFTVTVKAKDTLMMKALSWA